MKALTRLVLASLFVALWCVLPLGPRTADHAAAQTRKALVLEPFAWQLGRGDTAGQQEIDALTTAGFSVDVLRNEQVTVAAVEHLSGYAFVYMETHAEYLPDGDAIVVVDETDSHPYADLYKDGSVRQACIAGDDCKHLYNAITAAFVSQHLGAFPDGSMLFLNGCALLKAPLFWSALKAKNVSTMISWDDKALSSQTEITGSFMLNRLAAGDSTSAALEATDRAGLAISSSDQGVAHLGFLGDGQMTLSGTEAPESTATPAPTVAVPPAEPLITSAKLLHRVNGRWQATKTLVHGEVGRFLVAWTTDAGSKDTPAQGHLEIARGGETLIKATMHYSSGGSGETRDTGGTFGARVRFTGRKQVGKLTANVVIRTAGPATRTLHFTVKPQP